MTMLGIDYGYSRQYEKCSQGEKQKILIARGLMAEPKLLILDEPTTGLDFIAKEDLLQTIEQIAKAEDAPTIIFVTHHIEEVLPTFSHMLLLENGSVFAEGLREDVLTSDHMSRMYDSEIQDELHNNRA